LDEPARSGCEDHEDERRRTRLAHKAEHAVDLETGAMVAVTLQGADHGIPTTTKQTLAEAMKQLDAVADATDAEA
jgi:hypothetical protein